MPKVTQEHQERMRLRIMQAAFQCAARKGFHQTTMRDICEQAQLSIGAVYNHFNSKEAILEAMTIQGRQAKKDLFKEIEACDSAGEGLHLLFHQIFYIYNNKDFRTFGAIDLETYGEATRNKKIRQIMVEELQSLKSPLSKIIVLWQRKGEIRKDIDPSYIADTLIAFSIGIKVQLLIQSDLETTGFEDVVNKALLDTFLIR